MRSGSGHIVKNLNTFNSFVGPLYNMTWVKENVSMVFFKGRPERKLDTSPLAMSCDISFKGLQVINTSLKLDLKLNIDEVTVFFNFAKANFERLPF